MYMKKNGKRWIIVLLAALMLTSCAQVSAADRQPAYFTDVADLANFTDFTGLAETGAPQYSAGDDFFAPIEPMSDGEDVIYISAPEELAAIGGEQSAGKYYALANDIDLEDEWTPIDDFRGTFDGQGHSVNNLYVLADASTYVQDAGLFGYVDTLEHAVHIMNVTVNVGEEGIRAFRLTGSSTAGGIAGFFGSAEGSITNCHVFGDISAGGSIAYAGGIAGYYIGSAMVDCSATVNVLTNPYYIDAAGGLVGYFSYQGDSGGLSVDNCYADAGVFAFVFGNSYSPITSQSRVGGLIGHYEGNPSIITNCYARGHADASNSYGGPGISSSAAYAGGLIGRINSSISVVHCYATGNVSAEANTHGSYIYVPTSAFAGGIYGGKLSSAAVDIVNTYRLSTQELSSNRLQPNDAGTILTPEQMRMPASFIGWDFQKVWGSVPHINDGFPILTHFGEVSGLFLNKYAMTLVTGDTEALTAFAVPNQGVVWQSSDEGVATVDGGLVSAISAGSATITVTTVEDAFTTSCEVTIIPRINVTGLTLNKSATTLIPGRTELLIATVVPGNATNSDIVWSSSDEGVAAVDSGKVTAISVGGATITATTVDGNKTASCEITVAEPFLDGVHYIETEEQLKLIADGATGEYYLESDIILTSEWTPINDFIGLFDGQGHTIGNLYVLESSKREDAGFFGQIGADAQICNLGIRIGKEGVTAFSANAANYKHAGGLIGHCISEVGGNVIIENCYVTGGSVTALSAGSGCMSYAGGLIGRCFGRESFTLTVNNCHATADVVANSTGQAFTGGLIGTFFANDTSDFKAGDCYATGDVTAVNAALFCSAGGFTGLIIATGDAFVTIENCYITGDISSALNAGGFVGLISAEEDATVEINNSYRLLTQTVEGFEIDGSADPLSAEEMQMQDSFTGWDFEDVWAVDPAINNGYPYLQSQKPQEQITVENPGDVSDDGVINMQDVLLIYQCFRGKVTFSNEQIAAADVSGDGAVNMTDVLLVYQYFRGMITSF